MSNVITVNNIDFKLLNEIYTAQIQYALIESGLDELFFMAKYYIDNAMKQEELKNLAKDELTAIIYMNVPAYRDILKNIKLTFANPDKTFMNNLFSLLYENKMEDYAGLSIDENILLFDFFLNFMNNRDSKQVI